MEKRLSMMMDRKRLSFIKVLQIRLRRVSILQAEETRNLTLMEMDTVLKIIADLKMPILMT